MRDEEREFTIHMCSLLGTDVELNSEQLMKRKFSSGDVVNGVVEQV